MRALAILVASAAALTADPSTLETRRARIQALLQQQDFQAALDEARILNRDRPDDIAGYQLLAAAHLELGNYDDADKALQWMLDLRIGKADSAGWLLLARFREAIGDVDGALEAVNSAFGRLTPGQDREARALLVYSSQLLLAAGRPGLAEQAAVRAQTGAPDDPQVLETLGRVRLAQGKREEGVRLLREAGTGGTNARLLYRIAEATGSQADFAAFQRAARDRMDHLDNANRELILYLAGPGKRPAEALALARRGSARRRDVLTLDALAVALFAGGRTAEARSTMQSVLAVGTRDPGILQHAAQMGVKPE